MFSTQEMNDSVREAVNELVMEDGNWASVLSLTLRHFRDNEYPPSYVEVFMQKWERFKSVSIYDAYAFLQCHCLIQFGRVAMFKINVGQSPEKDSCIEENKSILRSISPPFAADFWGGTQGEDGFVSWDKPVHGVVVVDRPTGNPITVQAILPPQRVALEVGYVDPCKMWGYLLPHIGVGAVARWPYHSEYIYVITSHMKSQNAPEFDAMQSRVGEPPQDFAFDDERNPHRDWSRWVSPMVGTKH